MRIERSNGRLGDGAAVATLAGICFAVATLPGCEPPTADASAQIVATVNDQQISTAQVDQALHEAGADATTPNASGRALKAVIDEELLVQGALKSDLQRDPDVVRELERARRRILANAYAVRHVYPHDAFANDQLAKYYRDHPELFSERRTYGLATFTVDHDDIPESMREALRRSHGAEDVRRILESHGVKFETEVTRKTAEQVPLEQLPVFATAKAGDVLIIPQRRGREKLLTFTSIERTPIGFELAKPLIEQYLMATRNRAALEAYLRSATANARITYTESRPTSQQILASNATK